MKCNENNLRELALQNMIKVELDVGLDSYAEKATGNHVLLFLPNEAKAAPYWETTKNLKQTLTSLKEKVSLTDLVASCPIYNRVLQSIRKGKCEVFIYRPDTTNTLTKLQKSLKSHTPPIPRKRPEVIIESWAVQLKVRSEFTCVISLDPSTVFDVQKTIINRAMRIWRRIARKCLNPENNWDKAHVHYGHRHASALADAENFIVRKLAIYSSRAVFARHRIAPSSDWIAPTKTLPASDECICFTHNHVK